jgi:hypothetical protein
VRLPAISSHRIATHPVLSHPTSSRLIPSPSPTCTCTCNTSSSSLIPSHRRHSDVLSDLTTQMLLNQICHGERAEQPDDAPPAAGRRGHISGLPYQFATFRTCPPNPSSPQSGSQGRALVRSVPVGRRQ